LEVGGEVNPAEAGIWIPDIRLGGFRKDESRLPFDPFDKLRAGKLRTGGTG
jgi:hypothetical protein